MKLKCDVEDGMPSKACRPCYDKIMKFKKFKEISENSTAQHRSMIRFKRCMSKGDSPLLISSGHARSGKNEVGRIRKYQGASSESSSRTSRARAEYLYFLPPQGRFTCPINFSVSRKRRELPWGLFPQSPPKPMYSSYQGGVSPEGGLEVGRPGLRAKIISYQKIYGAVWKSSQT